MQLRLHNLLASRVLQKSLLLAFLFLTSNLTFAAQGAGAILSNPGMIIAMKAVAHLNYAMTVASKNPQDNQRRIFVQQAMAQIPVAIVALAQQFQGNTLHDADFKIVMGMLGKYVDVNAPHSYNQFLKNPSRTNIPSLGGNFPKQYLDEAKSRAVITSDENAGLPAKVGAVTKSDLESFQGNELVDLNSFAASQAANEKISQATISSDESAGISTATKASLLPEQKNSAYKAPVTEETNSIDTKLLNVPVISGKDLASEVKRIEKLQNELLSNVSEKNKEKESDEFFKSVNKESGKAKKEIKRKTKRQSSYSPTGKLTPFLFLAERILFPEAHAEESEESGQKSGQILFGLAAIMTATAMIVAPIVQANADKEIAKINAATQVTLTNITATNAKYMADVQSNVALTQTSVAKQIAFENNEASTQRLDMQLGEIKSQRAQQFTLEQEKRTIEKDYNNRRIALAEKQAQDQVDIQKQTLVAQLTQAGLSQGFSNNGGNRLSVDRVTSAARSYSSGSTTGNLSNALAGTNGVPQGIVGGGAGLKGPNLSGAVASRGVASTQRNGSGASLSLGIGNLTNAAFKVTPRVSKKAALSNQLLGNTTLNAKQSLTTFTAKNDGSYSGTRNGSIKINGAYRGIFGKFNSKANGSTRETARAVNENKKNLLLASNASTKPEGVQRGGRTKLVIVTPDAARQILRGHSSRGGINVYGDSAD